MASKKNRQWENLVLKENLDTDLDELIRKYSRSKGFRFAAAFEDYNGVHTGYVMLNELCKEFGISTAMAYVYLNRYVMKRKRNVYPVSLKQIEKKNMLKNLNNLRSLLFS